MKAIYIILLIFFASCQGRAQDKSPNERLIQEFLFYVNSPACDIDTIDMKFLVSYPVDTTIGSRERRQKFLKLMVIGLKNHLENVNLNAIKVMPYSLAPDSLQILMLGEEYSARSYVVTDSKAFTRYILIKNNHIQAFDLFQKAFWLMD